MVEDAAAAPGAVVPPGTAGARRSGIRPGGPYWSSLDGIRGVTLIVIVTYHIWPFWAPGASIAIDSFFVLSAFLITSLLVRERERSGRIRLGRFYLRRALRLLPVLVVVVPAASVLAWVELPGLRTDLGPAAQSTLLYYANLRAAAHPSHMAVFLPMWSLSTEEQFYLMWPSLLLGLLALRLRPRAIVAVSVVLFVASAGWLLLAHHRGVALSALYFRPDLRAGGILLGTALGTAWAYGLLPAGRWVTRVLPALTAVSLAYLVTFIARPQLVPAKYQATLAIVAACLAWGTVIVQQVVAPLRVLDLLLGNRVVVWLGTVSYTVYVVHVPVIRIVRGMLGAAGPGEVALIAVPVILAVTVLLHQLVEQPALRLKDRRFEPA